MKNVTVKEHYDLLVQEGNDLVFDPPVLQGYMNKWDGQVFLDALALTPERTVLEIGVGTGRLADSGRLVISISQKRTNHSNTATEKFPCIRTIRTR